MTDLTTKQLQWACAMLERKCPGCSMCNPRNIVASEYGYCMDGTGRIPLLDGVREECLCLVGVSRCASCLVADIDVNLELQPQWTAPLTHPSGMDKMPQLNCQPCYGLGYTPTENMWKWFDSLVGIAYAVNFCLSEDVFGCVVDMNKAFHGYSHESSKQAFYSALYQALLSLAINGKEVEVRVQENIR